MREGISQSEISMVLSLGSCLGYLLGFLQYWGVIVCPDCSASECVCVLTAVLVSQSVS